MNKLTADDFGDFFEALQGYPPFRWQQRLANQVCTGDWPEALALPTASGKTACIDAAIFALACQADWPSDQRTAPRRIFLVVDRRIVVDEGFERAIKIARVLRNANAGVLLEVARRLRSLAGDSDSEPLVCCQLRGGVYRDHAWAKTPTQPTVICSTVDQIGSRLLFRGYGLGWGTRVVHAGLAANDSLIILDEAHCAQPFYQTGQAIRQYRGWCDPEYAVRTPFHFVVMSATPPAQIATDAVFPRPEVWAADLREPDQQRLAARINASKPACLVEPVKDKNARSTVRLVTALVERALGFADEEHPRIGIIVNRVQTARDVFQQLTNTGHDAILLTGRMRGVDRDELLGHWRPKEYAGDVQGLSRWFEVSDEREHLDHPVFVVATQCLEVGANLDFDALVTECASLDALRQRFGRLNRGGRPIAAHAAIMIRADQAEAKETDFVYGDTLARTWAWLNEIAVKGVVDLGIAALETGLAAASQDRGELLSDLNMASSSAPVMLPAHVDCWVQTSPTPMPDPDPAIFLHGAEHGPPELQLCWRGDLSGEDQSDDIWPEQWIEAVSLCPPTAAECLPVPLHVVRRWLRGDISAVVELADVAAASSSTTEESAVASLPAAIVWRGPDDSCRLKSADDLRPGDTLVLPVRNNRAEWQLFGHIPTNANGSVILDRGDEANFTARGKAVLRLHSALWPLETESDAFAKLRELLDSDSPQNHAGEFRDVLRDLLETSQVPLRLRELVTVIVNARRRPRVTVHPCPTAGHEVVRTAGVVVTIPGRFRVDVIEEIFTNEDDSSSLTREVELEPHLDGVTDFARRFATASGLSEQLVSDFALAAQWHDVGKLDERFQAWLRGGDALKAILSSATLAKSGGATSRAARRRARERSGYPVGARHELLSSRLLEESSEFLNGAFDRDLVLHLVASHHGYCRPFAPVVLDQRPVEVSYTTNQGSVMSSSATGLDRLDSGVPERFWRLVRRYGWWGLAWLESIFVLADHRCSETEQQRDNP